MPASLSLNGDERLPLLQPPQSPPSAETDHDSSQSTTSLKAYLARAETHILFGVFALQFLASFAKHVIEVPFIALIQRTICVKYYRSHDGNHRDHLLFVAAEEIAEKLCKVVPVQNKLATVTGYKFAFDALPGLLTAIFYGSYADQRGRRPVLFLFSAGMIASLLWIVLVCYWNESLPVNLVLASSIFIFLGGGQRVFKSMLFTIVADTIDESHRTRYMYLLSSIPHAVTLIAPPFANLFMRISIWLPFEVACALHLTAFFITWSMPESLKHQHTAKLLTIAHVEAIPPPIIDDDEWIPRHIPGRGFETESLPPHHHEVLPSNTTTATTSPPRTEGKISWSRTLRDLISLFSVPTLPFVFLLYFLKPIALISKAFTYQFASESFGWAMSQTTWLRVSQAGGSALVTMLLLPFFPSAFLIRRGYSARKLDLAAIRGSLAVAIVGFAMLWQTRASWMLVLALFTCGLSEGLEPALQGLATSLISKSHYARIFTTFAVLETIAKLIGGPLMARLFSIGRKKGGHGSQRFNFLTSSLIFVVLEAIAWTARVE